jgi:hypothetical protein
LCGELKAIAALLGLQLDYRKFCCFLCGWDRKYRYIHKQWPERESLMRIQKNLVNTQLIVTEIGLSTSIAQQTWSRKKFRQNSGSK